jgi:hypothetical protein
MLQPQRVVCLLLVSIAIIAFSSAAANDFPQGDFPVWDSLSVLCDDTAGGHACANVATIRLVNVANFAIADGAECTDVLSSVCGKM